jgi:TRAP transporter TAXI family solute receptor
MKFFLRLGILFLLFVTFFVYIYTLVKPIPIKKITIATGRNGGVYYAYALRYQTFLEEEGIDVTIIETAGSVETLKLLNEKKVDIGFVQGGTASSKDKEQLKSIASIYFEPLWLFYRASMGKVSYLNELNGTRISIGETGSGTRRLTQKILAQTNLKDTSSQLNLNIQEAYQKFKKGELDVFFTVLSPQSLLIKEILHDKSVTLLDMKRIRAFSDYFPFLKEYTIPEGLLDLKENIPSQDIKLLATTATLVTHNRVEDSLVRLVVMKIKQQSQKGDIFPSQNYLEIPIHTASEKYLFHGDSFLEKIFPYWIASNIDRLKFLLIPLLTLLIPLFKSLIPLYRWRSRAKVYRWYRKLDEITENWENFDSKEVELVKQELNELAKEIRSKTDVPLSFKWEYHTLQHHIDNVLERIDKKIE